jgi:hypothetical protein
VQQQEILLATANGATVPAARPSTLARRWWLVALLVVLNALDVVTTHLVLENGGVEGNPIMKPLVDELWHGALVKAVCLGIVASLLARCPKDSRRADCVLGGVCGWYLLVVLWNASVIARLV